MNVKVVMKCLMCGREECPSITLAAALLTSWWQHHQIDFAHFITYSCCVGFWFVPPAHCNVFLNKSWEEWNGFQKLKAVHFTSLHPLHCITNLFIARQYAALYSTFHSTALCCTPLHLTATSLYSSMHATTQHFTVIYFTALLLFTVHYFTFLYPTSPYSTTLEWTALHCTVLCSPINCISL